MRGLVALSTGAWYEIWPEDPIIKNHFLAEQKVKARLRGKLKIAGFDMTNPVVVGDKVTYSIDNNGDFLIENIDPRQNYIIRRSVNLSKRAHIIASNIDQALLVVTLKHPTTSTIFVDRFLVTCESFRIPVILIFNKIDIYQEEDLALLTLWEEIYQPYYQILKISSFNSSDIERLKTYLVQKTSVISGLSGVGKSTLINQLDSSFQQKTTEISSAFHQTGKHTTTYAQMFPLTFGGQIVDTPGIRGLGFYQLKKEEIGHYFPEIRQIFHQCRFSNCTHTHEPDCAVLKAVEEGKFSTSRYESYCSFLEEDQNTYRQETWT